MKKTIQRKAVRPDSEEKSTEKSEVRNLINKLQEKIKDPKQAKKAAQIINFMIQNEIKKKVP